MTMLMMMLCSQETGQPDNTDEKILEGSSGEKIEMGGKWKEVMLIP